MQAKFTTAILLSFVLITASACGGSGSGDELRSSLKEAEQALAAEKEKTAEAERQAAEAAKAAKEAADAAAAAKKAADDAKEKAKAEADKEAEDKIAEEQQKAKDAEEAQRQAQQKQQELQEQLTEAQQAELNARASQYITAINTGGTDRTSVTVTHERGSTLKINPGGNFETGSGAPAISGFTPHTYAREVGVSGRQTLYLYTNIQAPGTRAFWKDYGLEVTDAHADEAQKPTPTAAARVVRVGDDLDYSDGATYDIAVAGTYDGVSGTYTCSACAIIDGDDADSDITAADFNAADWVALASGKRSFVSGNNWNFKPSSITNGVRQMRDNEHLYFGIWTQEPNVVSEAHSYQYIVGGSSEAQGSVSAQTLTYNNLTGTAKFAGGAVGKYATRNQVGENAVVGTFTAAVNLTANFDADTLEGRITNFRDGSRALANWNVYLGGSATGPVTSFDGSVSDAHVEASIGGVSATGQWDATLHGKDNPGRTQLATAPDAATKYPLDRYPQADLAGIVGNFHASSTNAAIAGAFGATPK